MYLSIYQSNLILKHLSFVGNRNFKVNCFSIPIRNLRTECFILLHLQHTNPTSCTVDKWNGFFCKNLHSSCYWEPPSAHCWTTQKEDHLSPRFHLRYGGSTGVSGDSFHSKTSNLQLVYFCVCWFWELKLISW